MLQIRLFRSVIPAFVLAVSGATFVSTAPASAASVEGAIVAWGKSENGQTTVPDVLKDAKDATALAAGQNHSLALRSNGTVVAWGSSGFGATDVPAGLSDVVAISAGSNHNLALKSDGTVVAWGWNALGQSTVPPGVDNAIAIAAGQAHSIAVNSDGTVTVWGDDDHGQITEVPTGLTSVVSVAAGFGHSLALKSDGTVVGWGLDDDGQASVPQNLSGIKAISAGSFTSYALKEDGTVVSWGVTHFESELQGIKAITAGFGHSLALKTDGTVVAAGRNIEQQTDVPENLSNVVAIAAGQYHSLALVGPSIEGENPTISGTAQVGQELSVDPGTWSPDDVELSYQWFRGGTPIAGATSSKYTPVKLDGGQALSVKVTGSRDGSESVSKFSSLLLVKHESDDLAVKAWGYNKEGQSTVPNDLTGVVAVAAGFGHSLALKSDGTVVGWGANNQGQSVAPEGLSGVVAIAAGSDHSLALKSDGTVVPWGRNNFGQATVPDGLAGVVAIAAGEKHSLALKSDGTVVAWGLNDDDQATVPDAATDVQAIAAGKNHNLALKSDGTVLAWGSNNQDAATVPAAATDVVAIAAGGSHSLALKSDGTAVAWGSNQNWQNDVPDDLADVVAIADGEQHSLALKADGTIVGWGKDDHYQIIDIPAGFATVAISAGSFHNLALGAPIQSMTTAQPSISGTFAVDETLTANPGAWTSGASFSYQWFNNGKAIVGATNRTYVVKSSDLGDNLKVRVTGTKFGYTTAFRDSSSSAKILTSSKPTVSGSMTVGSTLSVSRKTWSSKTSFSYQWLRDGATISKATKSTYKLGSSDEGHVITVRVTGKRSGYVTTARVSDAGAKVLKVATPTVTGDKYVGASLTANPGAWSDQTDFSYQWLNNGKAIDGATNQTYEIQATDVGDALAVRVTGAKDGHVTIAKTSSQSAKILASTVPQITGTVAVGSTLGINRGTWSSKVSFSYQWLRDGQPIKKATKSTYKLTTADNGKPITVRVTGKRSGYATVSRTSDPMGW